MLIINNKTIKDFIYSNILYELHKIDEKIKLFENKYKSNFFSFEKSVIDSGKEDFEKWDDYIEWKAYIKSRESLVKNKEEIACGNYKIS